MEEAGKYPSCDGQLELGELLLEELLAMGIEDAAQDECGIVTGTVPGNVGEGVPVVALLGPSNPQWIGPYGQEEGIVRIKLPCAPCNKRDCPDQSCMLRITPEMVLEKVEERMPRL